MAWMINPRTSVHLKIEDELFGDFILDVGSGITVLLNSQ